MTRALGFRFPKPFGVVVFSVLLTWLVRYRAEAEGLQVPLGAGSAEVRSPHIEYQPGELPLIICAPHGGREKPASIPDRTKGTFAFDTNTQELARSVAEAFKVRSGKSVFVVICKIHRTKLDCNREPQEGAAGQPEALLAWEVYHGAIRRAIKESVNRFGGAFLVDLHGHGHKIQRLEIGYGHGPETLGLPEIELNKETVWSQSSLAALVHKGPSKYAELLSGPSSFGSLMERAGYPSTPSSQVPVPPVPFFNGGYTIRTHASAARNVGTLQIETNYLGVRDTAESRQKFASTFVDVMRTYLGVNQGLEIPTKPLGVGPVWR